MSSTRMTVGELKKKLDAYPDDTLVVLSDACYNADDHDEGFFNGPQHFNMIPVTDVRTGFNFVKDGTYIDTQALHIACCDLEWTRSDYNGEE